jgi:hypothetical protein
MRSTLPTGSATIAKLAGTHHHALARLVEISVDLFHAEVINT